MVALPMQTHHDQYMQVFADVVFQRPISLTRCAHVMSDMCRTWVILPAIERHCLPKVYKPWLMVPPITNVDLA